MYQTIYLRMLAKVNLKQIQEVKLGDIAKINAPKSIQSKIENLPIYRITKKDNNVVVIDGFLIIKHLKELFSEKEIQLIGPMQTIIYVEKEATQFPIFMLVGVWILLFIGAGMTIMNFHYDVSMQEVHQKLHLIITGQTAEYPLWIQIPYSIGLGVGMLLFFNHWFNKKINDEPSPLEIEIFNYQQELDQYLIISENQLDDVKPPL